jgi:hypothetical protein
MLQLGEKDIFGQHSIRNFQQGAGRICGGKSFALFIRNDHLSVSKKHFIPNPYYATQDSDYNWVGGLQYVDVLVLNKGHHVSDEGKTLESFTAQTKETAAFLGNVFADKSSPLPTVFYVTTSPGHPDCNLAFTAGPTMHALDAAPVYMNSTNMATLYPSLSEAEQTRIRGYKWDKFHENDLETLAVFAEHKVPLQVLDVGPLSLLRPDAHMSADDCLHFGTPGVPDNWIYILFNGIQLQLALNRPGTDSPIAPRLIEESKNYLRYSRQRSRQQSAMDPAIAKSNRTVGKSVHMKAPTTASTTQEHTAEIFDEVRVDAIDCCFPLH